MSTQVKGPVLERVAGISIPAHSGWPLMLVVACHLLVLGIYIWLTSLGASAKLPSHTTYYDQLASAFLHGGLALDEKPDPALLALSNPYDPAQRGGIHFPLDVSLYRGKYYLYFGPTPALLLMIPKALFPGQVGDQYLVLFFIYGIFFFESVLLLRLWKRFFPDLPPWLLGAGLLFMGLIAPFTWTAGKPNVYSAAVAGGQFFFLAGLYAAFDALDGDSIQSWKLAVTGLLWSAALGSRITLILPIGLMSILVLIASLRKHAGSPFVSGALPPLAALGLTLALGLGSLAWYNWARFGSPFETGIRYQLAGPDLQANRSKLFSPAYVIQNLYNYGLNPPAAGTLFPYFYSATGKMKPLARFLPVPEFYHAERVTGMLYTSPLILMGLVPAIDALLRRRNAAVPGKNERFLQQVILGLYGCFLAGFVFFMLFFWASERYLLDLLPPFVLLSVIGFWQLARHFNTTRPGRWLYALAGVSLITISIIVSTLLALGTSPLQY